MSRVIDRRPNGKNKSAVNRQRFINRFKKQIKKSVEKAVSKRSITDIEKGEKINIPAKDISEPIISHGKGGSREMIHPGNNDFMTGDKFKRPDNSKSEDQGSEASDCGEGADDFGFEISREEFLEIFFEDLSLPDLVKKQISKIPNFKMTRAGITQDGTPTNLNIARSMKSALGRRTALSSPYKKKLARAERELEELKQQDPINKEQIEKYSNKIKILKKRLKSIPFLDNIDLKYNNRIKHLVPTTQAVMFCLMDVSGSMDEMKKDIAKRFFILLYLFLNKNYEHIELVFIRHHTSAKEVDEQEFFYSRETGGTVVSSALELMHKVIVDRFPASEWNIYAAQASDGDNWNADSPHCRDLIMSQIMPHLQHFSYVEIMPRHHQSLWEMYTELKKNFSNFDMQKIDNRDEIYPVFRKLFKRQQYA